MKEALQALGEDEPEEEEPEVEAPKTVEIVEVKKDVSMKEESEVSQTAMEEID